MYPVLGQHGERADDGHMAWGQGASIKAQHLEWRRKWEQAEGSKAGWPCVGVSAKW